MSLASPNCSSFITMHLIITGASGLVGSSALAYILTLPTSIVSRVTLLSRKPVALAEGHEQVKTIIHTDFASYPPDLISELQGAHGIIWALGVSQNDVDKNEYIKITKDWTLEAAKAFTDLNGDKGFNFVYVSGEGATLKPGMFTPIFGRVKGETEQALLTFSQTHPNLRAFSARPGGVDPYGHEEVLKQAGGKRTGMLKVADVALMPLIRNAYKSMHSPTKDLGKALVELAIGDGQPLTGTGIEGEGRTITNVGLRRIAGI